MNQEPSAAPGPASKATVRWLILIGVGLGALMSTIDASIVNITLPTLETYFHTDFATVEWVILGYILIMTALTLGVARLGDLMDKKLLYLIGLFLFTAGSFLCAISPSVYWLIGFRVLQGLGAALTSALGAAIITQIFPPQELGKAFGFLGSILAIGIAAGPPLGGLIIGTVGWHWIFLVNVPIGIISLVFVARFVPKLPAPNAQQRFDLAGAVILFVALGAYALAMTFGQDHGFTNPSVLILLGVGLLGMLVFVLVERRIAQPMIDFRMFKNFIFDLNLLMGLLVSVVLAGLFILPYYLELVKNYSTLMVGILMMIDPLGLAIVAPLSGVLSDRFGSRISSILGLAVVAFGCMTLGALRLETSQVGFVLHMIPIGIGMGLFMSPNNSAIMGAVPKEHLGITSGLMNLTRLIGQTTGLPLMGVLFSAVVMRSAGLPTSSDVTIAPPSAVVAGTQGAFHAAAIGVALAILVAVIAFVVDMRRRASKKIPVFSL
ncbi:MAG: MFS transporter [Anaerolineaceae bacterium]|nr:MFS transporter [Anaerolineaceae bacterium]